MKQLLTYAVAVAAALVAGFFCAVTTAALYHA